MNFKLEGRDCNDKVGWASKNMHQKECIRANSLTLDTHALLYV